MGNPFEIRLTEPIKSSANHIDLRAVKILPTVLFREIVLHRISYYFHRAVGRGRGVSCGLSALSISFIYLSYHSWTLHLFVLSFLSIYPLIGHPLSVHVNPMKMFYMTLGIIFIVLLSRSNPLPIHYPCRERTQSNKYTHQSFIHPSIHPISSTIHPPRRLCHCPSIHLTIHSHRKKRTSLPRRP